MPRPSPLPPAGTVNAGRLEPTPTAGIQRRIRRELPADAFRPYPRRVWTAIGLVVAIALISVGLVAVPCPAPAALLLSVSGGCLYASLFFLGHEAGHGAVVRSRRAQDLLMTAAFAIFVLSPTLWRVWHNKVHHTQTNREEHDPDNFGTLASYHALRSVRAIAALTPGSGRWLSLLYLPTWFTGHAQVVLWVQSRRCRGFELLNRRRAVIESGLMAAFWLGLAWQLGGVASLLVIVVPMLVANGIIMSYIVTNHLLRPLDDHSDPLASSMSVSTHPWLDRIHFNFSHHVEHHLFPAMSSRFTPLVRRKLCRYARGRFLAPAHSRALRLVFGTPRIHDGPDTLVDPPSGRRATFAEIGRALGMAADTPTAHEVNV